MGTINTTAVAAALQVNFEADIVTQINRAVPLLTMLEMRNANGQNITWDAKFNTTFTPGSASAIAEGANVSTFSLDTKVPATLPYGTYHEAFEVTGKALAIATASGNPMQIAELFIDSVNDACERLAQSLGVEIYLGDGTSERMVGLLGGAILSSGTYANINRATYAQWQGNVVGNGGSARANSLSLMRSASRAAFIASGRRPDMIVTSPLQHDKYGELIDPQRRYLQEVKGPSGDMIRLDGGFRSLEFEGVPVIEDVNCPAGKMIFLNRKHVLLRQLPQPSDSVTGARGEIQLQGGEDDVSSGVTPLSVRIQPLAVNGDLYRFAIYVYPQLQVRRPNSCVVLEDLA